MCVLGGITEVDTARHFVSARKQYKWDGPRDVPIQTPRFSARPGSNTSRRIRPAARQSRQPAPVSGSAGNPPNLPTSCAHIYCRCRPSIGSFASRPPDNPNPYSRFGFGLIMMFTSATSPCVLEPAQQHAPRERIQSCIVFSREPQQKFRYDSVKHFFHRRA